MTRINGPADVKAIVDRHRSTDAVVPGPRHPMSRTGDHRTDNRADQPEQQYSAVRQPYVVQDRSEHPAEWSGPVPDRRQDHAPDRVDYSRYADIAALLAGDLPEPPSPTYGMRDDTHALFYAGEVNLIFGDPESGKTWLALSAAREILGLHGDGRVLVIDLDYNGAGPTVTRLLALGAAKSALASRERFLYVEPEDRPTLGAIVAEMRVWRPHIVIVDSLGELLPMFGSSSNSADDYTAAHRAVLKPLTKTRAAVLVIDHLAKNTESRTLGPGGTAAKRRTIGGVSLRVSVNDAFTPGKGGSAWLQVNKDRHGGLRRRCPTEGREPLAGLFCLEPSSLGNGILEPVIRAPRPGDKPPTGFGIGDDKNTSGLAADVAALSALDPPPKSRRDVATRTGWGNDRSQAALKAWREQTGANDDQERASR